jgi:hypothetical protein
MKKWILLSFVLLLLVGMLLNYIYLYEFSTKRISFKEGTLSGSRRKTKLGEKEDKREKSSENDEKEEESQDDCIYI